MQREEVQSFFFQVESVMQRKLSLMQDIKILLLLSSLSLPSILVVSFDEGVQERKHENH
jgi:hypothetical protein